MLSIKRLTWIISIALFISFVFLLINFQESTHDEVNIINDQYKISDLLNSEELFQKDERFVLVTSDSENLVFLNIKEQMEKWGKGFQVAEELKNFDQKKEKIYIFCEEEISKTTDLEKLVAYVEEGGTVLFAAGIVEGNKESYLNPIFGMTNKAYRVTGSTFIFVEDFLPLQEEVMKYGGFNSSTWIQLRDRATIYVEDAENGQAVIYSYPYGKGKSLMINASFMEDKNCMGMLAGLLSNEIEGFVYPVYNTKSFFLDNFPLVTYVDDEVSLSLFGRTTGDFVENVVWPVFQRVAVQDEIKYTSSVMTMGTGNPYYPDLDTALFYTMSRSALIYEGELVASADFSEEGDLIRNQSFYDSFHNFFPNYQLQALAISNGKYQELTDKEMKVVRGYMFGDEENMFLCEPDYKNDLYQFPVVTEGFSLDDGNVFTTAMQIASKGILSEKIDINTLIIDENEMPVWDVEKVLFADYEERIIDETKWMDSITLSESADYIHGNINLRYDTSYDEDRLIIHCANYRRGQCFYLQLPYEVAEVIGGELEVINGKYYLLRVLDDQVELIYDSSEN
jgi:hypothetical protein